MTIRALIDARYVDGSPSGIGRYTENVTARLSEARDIEIGAIVRDEEAGFALAADHVHVWDVEPNSVRTRHALARRFDWDDWDVFWSPFNILPEGVDVPAVFTLHDVMWLIDPSFCTNSTWRRWVTGTFYRTAIPRSVELADAILTVSHTSRRDIEQLFSETVGRVHVAYNAVDSRFEPMAADEGWPRLAPWMEKGTPYVLCVGQGSPYKNHGRALAAFWHAFAGDPDVKFVLVRRFERGPDPTLERWLNRPPVRERVIRMSDVDDDVLEALLAKAMLFAFPSLYEGFGLPALEAMASGTPVITANYGAMAEVSNGAAAEVDPLDVEAIAAAMRKIRDDPKYAGSLRRAGLARAAEFRWSQTAATVEKVLREVAR